MGIKKHEKILPIVNSPILVYVDYAYTLSIIRNYAITDAWFYSNYIQIYFQKNNDYFGKLKFFITDFSGRVWYPFLPCLLYQTIQRNLIKSLKINIVELLINAISEQSYIIFNWDEFYIKNGLSTNHFSHKTLIFGYNLEEKYFLSVGFKDSLRFEQCKISFNDVKKAFDSEINDQETAYHDTEICLMKFNEKFSYDFDIGNVINQLKSYYLSENPIKNYASYFNCNFSTDYFSNSNDFVFGMDAYKHLDLFIQKKPLRMDDCGRPLHDLWKDGNSNFQPFQCFWEHKKIMVTRLEYLKKMGYLPKDSYYDFEYKQIEEKAKLLRNHFIRYETTKNEFLITDMQVLLGEIYIEERLIIEKLIYELSKYDINMVSVANNSVDDRKNRI